LAIERRHESRLKQWFDGGWQGGSGDSRCRLSDVSVTGCFVNGLAAPAIGTRTTVTIDFSASDAMSLEGEVVYVERAMGFGVRFLHVTSEQLTQLQHLLDTYKKASA
jgi:PilZ domain-containing protein